MHLDDFVKYLTNYREILFEYKGRQYLASGFWMKTLFKKGYTEYWFAPPLDSPIELQTFKTIEELLDVKIDEQKLRHIIERVEIIVIY